MIAVPLITYTHWYDRPMYSVAWRHITISEDDRDRENIGEVRDRWRVVVKRSEPTESPESCLSRTR